MKRTIFDKVKRVEYKVDTHQHEAYYHLLTNPRACLFLGMSLSKTVICLSYLYDMHYREGAICKTLVIAPDKVARGTWPDQLNTWAHLEGMRYSLIAGDAKQRLAALNTDAELYLIGVDNLVWLLDLFIYQRVSKKTGRPYGPWLGSLPFDSLVIDELTLFKGRDSNRFKALRRALDNSEVPYRIGMTGTPAPNGYIDLWAQLLLIDDGERLGQTFGAYLDKYFTTRGNGMIVYEYIPKPNAVKVIAAKIQDIALTMATRDKVKLPPVYVVDELLDLAPFDREVYDQLEKDYVLEFLEGAATVKTPADLTNKLLQISSGAIYEDKIEGEKGPRIWHELNTVKLGYLGELLAKYPGENFILVYQFQHEVERVKRAFPFAVHLGNGKRALDNVAAWNRREIRLLMLHPAGGGHGLNLQFGGRRMVWFSSTWNLEHYDQTVGRLPRRGAVDDIYVHRLIVKGTRDVKVIKRQEFKGTNQDFLLNEIKELRRKYEKW